MRADDIVVIVGRKRSGKSYLIKNYFIPAYTRTVNNSLVIDDHVMERSSSEYSKFGYSAKFYNDVERYPKVVIYDKEASDASFAKIWEFTKRHGQRFGYTLFVIDEAHHHFQRRQLPTAQSEVIRENRHYNLGIILSSQRVYDFNPLVYKNADIIILFNTREPRERMWIEKYISKEVADLVPNLKQYHFVIFDVNSQRILVHKPI